jgi:hypothetical protein
LKFSIRPGRAHTPSRSKDWPRNFSLSDIVHERRQPTRLEGFGLQMGRSIMQAYFTFRRLKVKPGFGVTDARRAAFTPLQATTAESRKIPPEAKL